MAGAVLGFFPNDASKGASPSLPSLYLVAHLSLPPSFPYSFPLTSRDSFASLVQLRPRFITRTALERGIHAQFMTYTLILRLFFCVFLYEINGIFFDVRFCFRGEFSK